MSYTNKNDISAKTTFIHNFVMYYGIGGLGDTDTEIKSSELVCFDKMSAQIPEIQKLFKTSIMNLSRSDYKITKTNAISILKHLCIQTRIPFDITKYQKYYTFSLAPPNPLLSDYKTIHIKNVYLKQHVNRPLIWFKNLKRHVVENIVCEHTLPLDGFDMKKTPLRDIIKKSLTMPPIINIMTEAGISNVEWTAIDINHLNHIYEHDKQYFITIPIQRALKDILEKIHNITLYDQKGNIISSHNTSDICDQYLISLQKDQSVLDLPMCSLPYSFMKFKIKVENTNVFYYSVQYTSVTLSPKYRKMMVNSNQLNHVKDGYYHHNIKHPQTTRKIHIKNGKYELSHSGHFSICNVTSDNPITITYGSGPKLVDVTSVKQIPMCSYESVIISCDIKNFILEFDFDYSDNDPTIEIQGVLYHCDKDERVLLPL